MTRRTRFFFPPMLSVSFHSLDGNLFNDEVNYDRDWLDEARRYYANIVGKYGVMVQNALKKLSGLELAYICPLHGLVWRSEFEYLLDKYDKWSRYEAESDGVIVIYGSLYGHTENAAEILASLLSQAGVKDVRVYDASKTHVSELISEIFRVKNVVIASATYNAEIYTPVKNLIADMKALAVQNKNFALIENGSWAPAAKAQMTAELSTLKNCTFEEISLTVRSALKEKSNRDAAGAGGQPRGKGKSLTGTFGGAMKKTAVIGLGIIGGSICRALTRAGCFVSGNDLSDEIVSYAKREGVYSGTGGDALRI